MAGRPQSTEALKATSAALAGLVIPLRDEFLIGRSAPGDGSLGDDPALSRRHARIVRTAPGAIVLIDMGSSNGSWVNGERVVTCELNVGDRIEVGGTVLELTMATPEGEAPQAVETATDPAEFRAEFPVFRQLRYLNAGTDGPVPARAAAAARAQLDSETEHGRSGVEHWGNLHALWSTLRSRYARLLGCSPDEVAVTRATTDGANTVLAGLPLGRGDEILTTDEEHPGLLAPLAAARARKGFSVRVVPFEEVANEVGPQTRLAACSHVSWITGKVVDLEALRATGVPLLLDGAQALGAVPVDVKEIGCDFYAAPGQKWLCGPDRTGALYVRSERVEELTPPAWPSFMSLADTDRPLDLVLHKGARRFDPGFLPGLQALWALAALDVLEEAGIEWITTRGPVLAERLAAILEERGVTVTERGPSTLVSFEADDAPALVESLEADDVIVRDIPGRGYIRVSIGAWCLDEDLERLAELTVRWQAASSGALAPSPRRATVIQDRAALVSPQPNGSSPGKAHDDETAQ
ncbi:MAG: aminotransferase class V-fold PLP-dependent enzyme [Verrucomicrobiota bacterium]